MSVLFPGAQILKTLFTKKFYNLMSTKPFHSFDYAIRYNKIQLHIGGYGYDLYA